MGYRLSKIYTKTGDKGQTGLGDGSRVEKDNPRVACYGDVDELNSILGLLISYELPPEISGTLTSVQNDLFDLGGELSIPGHALLKQERVAALEARLDSLNNALEPLEEFILPGGSRAAAVCHVGRAVCRRAERKLVTLSRSDKVSDAALQYLNRLSDLLFVMARSINRSSGRSDVLWDRDRSDG
jgi:cob(I)alamin adenosyltransferase